MKKLLLGSIILSVFSIATVIFQMSCTKTSNAQSGGTPTSQSKFIYTLDPPQGDGPSQTWTANIDGTDAQQINITLPAGYTMEDVSTVTPDGKTIIFVATINNSNGAVNETGEAIFSCSINGGVATMLKSVTDVGSDYWGYTVGNAY